MPKTNLKTIAIVGLGQIGASLAMALHEKHPSLSLIGIDTDLKTLSAAQRSGNFVALGRSKTLLNNANLAVLCVPLAIIPSWMDHCAAVSGLLVTDCGSTKLEICRYGDPLLEDRFLGGHPLAGTEQSGFSAGDPSLFQDHFWIFTPKGTKIPSTFNSWVNLVQSIGGKPCVLSPKEHDSILALTSHLPLALSAALVQVVSKENLSLPLLAGGYRSMTRLAGGPLELANGIVATNRLPLLRALKAYRSELDKLIDLIERSKDGNLSEVLAYFKEAKRNRLEDPGEETS